MNIDKRNNLQMADKATSSTNSSTERALRAKRRQGLKDAEEHRRASKRLFENECEASTPIVDIEDVRKWLGFPCEQGPTGASLEDQL